MSHRGAKFYQHGRKREHPNLPIWAALEHEYASLVGKCLPQICIERLWLRVYKWRKKGKLDGLRLKQKQKKEKKPTLTRNRCHGRENEEKSCRDRVRGRLELWFVSRQRKGKEIVLRQGARGRVRVWNGDRSRENNEIVYHDKPVQTPTRTLID